MEDVMVNADVTCHTDGCPNADIAIPVEIPDGAVVACGCCGQPITDIKGLS
jgi:hypothetical protein